MAKSPNIIKVKTTLSELRKIPLLTDLSDQRLHEVAGQMQLRAFSRNDIVIQRGTPSESAELCILLQGRLKAVAYSPGGKEIGFSFIKTGDHFGEMALIDGLPRSASIISIEKSIVGFLSTTVARQLMFSEPSVSEMIMRKLTTIIRQSNDHIILLGHQHALSRICALLLQIQTREEDSSAPLAVPTQQEIASLTNTTRETVSRVFSQLQEEEVIEKSGKKVMIKNTELLEKHMLEGS